MSPLSSMAKTLKVLPCLSNLREDDFVGVERMASMRRVPKNTILFSEKEPATIFFIVRDGSIRLYKSSPEGRTLTIKTMGPGDYFCCAPLYTDGKHFVGASTLEDSVLVAIPADDFRRTLRNEVTETGWKMISSLCSKISYLSNLVENLTFKNVEQRVMIAIWRSAEETSPGKKVVTLSLTHQEIASMTGTVREVVSRAMLKLKKEHVIIESSINGFTVDREKLMALLREP